MQRTTTALAIIAFTLGLGPVAAQQPEQLAVAREMMVVMRATDNFDAVLPSIMQAMKPVITRGDAKAAKDWDEIAPAMAQEFSSTKTKLVDDMAGIYAKAFDTAELRQFVDFYKTPAGAKLARLTPILAQQTMAAGQKLGQEVATRLGTRMQEELRKRGHSI